MNATSVIKTYAKVGIESGVSMADPHKLISMLYQGALQAIANAKNGILRKDVSAKGSAISKAISIIDEGLNASLDKSVGGELVGNLSSLYEYMNLRLLNANLKNDMDALDEVARLLSDLKEAWESIKQPSAATAAAMNIPAQPSAGIVTSSAATTQQNAVNKKVQMAYGRG